MVISILFLIILTLALTVLLAFHFQPDVSQFELERLAARSREYQQKQAFQRIYHGLKYFVNMLAVVDILLLATITISAWGAMGGVVALGAAALAFFTSRVVHGVVESFLLQHLGWFNKYLSWTAILGKLNFSTNVSKVYSRDELAHLVGGVDFMPETERDLILSAIKFPELKLADLMTPRAKISFVRDSVTLSPKIIDELFGTGQKLFPVVHSDLENTLGVIYLDDITNVAKGEQTLKEAAHERPAVINRGASLMEALDMLLSLHLSLLLLEDDHGKIVGMLELSTILETLLGRPIH